MQETPEQYRNRMLSHLAGKKPEKLQAGAAKKMERLIRRASASRLAKRPAPGKWSVAEILAHLADTELVYGYRVRAIIGDPGTPIPAFDQDAWALQMNYAKRPAKQSLAAFRALRVNNLALLKSLSPEKKQLFGIHAERGQESVATLVSMMAGHDLNHIRQMEAILRPPAASAPR
jgi:uncharacterized damage-inducible protein DinB